jgi:hypothetical protein
MLLALALGGCAIADSTIVDHHVSHPGAVACSSRLGSYALPKAFVHVMIGKSSDGAVDLVTTTDLKNGKFQFDIVHHPDPALTVCLDYLASIFSADEIAVTKQPATPASGAPAPTSRQFLQSVLVNATDKSVQIAQNLIKAAFVGLSGNPNFPNNPDRSTPIPAAKATILADLEFDPFDAHDSAEANDRLRRLGLGFCLVMEDFTYDRRTMSVDEYCNSPFRVRNHIPRVAELYAVKSREPVAPNTSGVLYRPLQTYLISVYQKIGGHWQLSRRVDAALENLSPVISVGISRAIFARRNAALTFDNGVLRTVCIAKTSEIENFVAIPFEISRSIVALPAQIVQVKINRIAKQTDLANVESFYIQTQAALLATLAGQQASNPGQAPAATPAVTVANNVAEQILGAPGLDPNANNFTFSDNNPTQAWINANCNDDKLLVPISAGSNAAAPH